MTERARVLVHGATGFTGRLVSAALRKRGIAFALGGRSLERLDSVKHAVGATETCVVDITDPESIRRAVEGRTVVCACAGPFLAVGESILSTCARSGVHYVDTTGEQLFVARAVTRYRATAEASGACIVPAMAYEIAPADWAAQLAAERLGGVPDGIDILYASRGTTSSASRGTKLSLLGQIAAGESMQHVGGTLVHEPVAEVIRTFELASGKTLTAVSFPSPEAVVVPSHTKAREVRTFMPANPRRARVLHLARRAAPLFARALQTLLSDSIGRAAEGPDTRQREASVFEIVAEARRGPDTATVRVSGRDPYGLTAEIQAYAAMCLLGGATARGVVAPSVAFLARPSLEALLPFGTSLV
jgi:short subunit dehydrogenase-like uncharacterized protein